MASLEFGNAFKYPFRRWAGLCNILWLLVPVYGWFLLIGWRVRIVTEFLEGKYKQVTKVKHGSDFKLGWVMFWKALPGILVIVAASVLFGYLRGLGTFLFVILVMLVVPVLALNFIKKRTIDAYFEFRLLDAVKKNLGAYIVALLKDLALSLVVLLMWVILVGLPAGAITKSIFTAEFFRKYVKA